MAWAGIAQGSQVSGQGQNKREQARLTMFQGTYCVPGTAPGFHMQGLRRPFYGVANGSPEW